MTKKKLRGIIGFIQIFLRVILLFSIPIILLIFKYYIWALVVIIIYYFVNAIVIINILNNKKLYHQSKATWILSSFILPGLLSYLWFSGMFITRKQRNIYKKSRLLENELSPKDIFNSEISVLNTGSEVFPKIFEEIENAKKYINIQYFIISDGIIFRHLFSLLKKKLKEGVKVRILYDHVGGTFITKKNFNELVLLGAEVKEFAKINWLQPNSSANFRNHNKIIIVDGITSFFGGLNLADEYAGIDEYYGDWYDVHYMIKGDGVKSFNAIFVSGWFISTGKNIKDDYNEYPLFSSSQNFDEIKILIDTPAKDEHIFYNELLKQISKSKTSIKIITPYIVITEEIKEEFRKAIYRGVKVEIITIGKIDKKTAYYVSSFDIDSLVEIGVKIYRTIGIFLHSKIYIFDNETTIFGTTNLDYRALFLHFETNIILKSKSITPIIEYFDNTKLISIAHKDSREDWWIGQKLMNQFLWFIKGNF